MSTWDVIVVGGGPAGENAAQYAAQGGLRAAIVEAELLGGECSYWACMPSKALLRPVEIARITDGLPVAPRAAPEVDGVLARRDRFTHDHDDSSQVAWARGAGLDVVRGTGRLAGERTVAVDGRTLHARHAVVLATGSMATLPPVEGLAEARPWTSRDVTNLRAVPERVVVIGGGVVACEAATWLAGLGARSVTIVEVADRLLDRNEPFAGELVREALTARGVDVRLGATVEAVSRRPVTRVEEGVPRGVAATVTVDGEAIVADEIVVAAGRRPRTDGIGLETVGLEDGGDLAVDDHLAVQGVDGAWLYAVGDCSGRALLTHMGKYQGRVCGDVIAARARGAALDDGRFRARADHDQVPQVAFTDPQVAAVGLTEEQARANGAAVRAVEVDLAAIAGASLARDDYAGRAKLVVDADRRVLLGATFVGSEAGELLHAATIAVVGRVTIDDLWHAVPSYPTVSEAWLRLLEELRT